MSYDAGWYLDIEMKVFSIVKANLVAKLKSKYKDLNVTMDGARDLDTKFPTVYVQTTSFEEIGADLVGDMINGIKLTTQVDVIVTKSQGKRVADEVSLEVMNAFKGMYFKATMPKLQFDSNGNVRTVSRFERVFGNGDKL